MEAEMYIRTLFYFFNKNGRISTPRARQKLSVTHSKDMSEIHFVIDPGSKHEALTLKKEVSGPKNKE